MTKVIDVNQSNIDKLPRQNHDPDMLKPYHQEKEGSQEEKQKKSGKIKE